MKSLKQHRKDINGQIGKLKLWPPTCERALAVTKLQEAVMWLSMDLKRIGEANPGMVANPYPHSKDPSSAVIDPAADGLNL